MYSVVSVPLQLCDSPLLPSGDSRGPFRGSRYALSQPDRLHIPRPTGRPRSGCLSGVRQAHLARGIRVKPQTSNIYTLYTATILHINLPVSHYPLLVHLRWISGDTQFNLSSRLRRRVGRRSRVVLAFRVFSVFRGSYLSAYSRHSLRSAWSLPYGSRPPSRGGYASLRLCVKIYTLYTFYTANKLSPSSPLHVQTPPLLHSQLLHFSLHLNISPSTRSTRSTRPNLRPKLETYS